MTRKYKQLLDFEPVAPVDRPTFIRDLALEFVRRRLQNAQHIELAKLNALDKLMERLEANGDQMAADFLLDLIHILNNATNTDMTALLRAASGSDGIQLMASGGVQDPAVAGSESDPNAMKVLPILARIVEILDKDKQKSGE